MRPPLEAPLEGTGRLDCAGLWTGSGAPLPASTIHFERGVVTGIEPCTRRAVPPVFAIPAFVDAHCHMSWTGLQEVTLDLQSVRSPGEMLDRIAGRAALLPPGEILRAENFDESTWERQEIPPLAELDAAAGDRPAILRRVCGHLVQVTSALMARLPDECPGLDRSTGRIREGAALDMDALFPPSEPLLAAALEAAGGKAFSLGLTALQTMEPLFVLEKLALRPPGIRLSTTVFHRDVRGRSASVLPAGGPADLRVLGMKIFLDGALGAGTAAVAGGFPDGTAPSTLYDDASLEEALLEASRLGLVPMIHAIGAGALRQIDRVSTGLARKDPRAFPKGVRIEHAEELEPAWPGTWDPSIHRFSMQPNFVSRWQNPCGMYHARLGAERADRLNPFGLVLRAGFDLGFGSDGMPLGPLEGLAGATGHPVPEYRLDVREALHAYTLGAAAISGFTDLARPVGAGRPADLTLLDGDPFDVPWDAIRTAATVMRGRVVHGPEELLSPEEGA